MQYFYVFKYAKKQREEFGKHVPAGLISIAILIILPALTFLIGGVTLNFQYPELNQLSDTVYNFKGGISIIPELNFISFSSYRCTQLHL